MFRDEKILAIIPARGGSKGIKDKNIYPLAGKPLLAYTIEAAKNSKYIDYVMVSTDSDDIADVATKYGAEVPFMRPAKLATDRSKTIETIVYVIDTLAFKGMEYDVMVLLQPTSPLRTTKDIDKALELFFEEHKKSLLSVSKVDDNPVLIRKVEGNRAFPILDVSSTVRRQDFDVFYKVNGAIYINAVNEINGTTSFNDNEIAYIMDKAHGLDIDTLEDIEKAKKVLT